MSSENRTAQIHFKNPPIVEAIIAINVARLPSEALQLFAESDDALKKIGYTRQEVPLTTHEFKMSIEQGKSQVSGVDTIQGFRFLSADGLYAAQFTLTGFVFSRLGSYESWEPFRDEAKRLWMVFLDIVRSVELLSFGVRYINKIFVPTDSKIEAFLKIYPHIPEDVPQRIQELFMRLGMPIPEPQGKLVHQQILLPPEKEGFATVMLDNDFQFPALGTSLVKLWDDINGVRLLKDDYFLKFITPKLMEAFDA